jgi:hypothetical protein
MPAAPAAVPVEATAAFAAAVAEAESLIRSAPFVETGQDLREGLDYLSGSIQACLRLAWTYDPERPAFINSTSQHLKMGLDNPDTVYHHANLRPDATYVVSGSRGTSTDLSFQILAGDYTPTSTPDGSTAFDDRALEVAEDGTFRLVLGPGPATGPEYVVLPGNAAMLAVREVFDDWGTERRGTFTIERVDSAPAAGEPKDPARRFDVAGKMLLSRIKTWFVFPEWFYLKEPVNTLTEPRVTPGGLTSQWSSAGHFDLAEDEAMILTVPRGDAPYLGFQLGSMWYISLDYLDHQTSLNGHQARIDPDGMIRIVVSERDPGLANWVERLGHRRGYLQFRWQRLDGDLTPADGPTLEIVPIDSLAERLPFHDESRVTPDEWAQRIAERRAGVSWRMIG